MPDDAPPVDRLMITQCNRCARWVHPPAADCPECGGDLVAHPVSGHGTVFTYTINHQPFNPALPVPYAIAIVELAEQDGLRIAANIVDCDLDSLRIGLPVEVRIEQRQADGAGSGPVFVPRLTNHS
jgi:uncharacterized OB-fold protein